jgi:hypothetical protein
VGRIRRLLKKEKNEIKNTAQVVQEEFNKDMGSLREKNQCMKFYWGAPWVLIILL